jgi:hypothetical protein
MPADSISSEIFSATMRVGILVLPRVTVGMIEAAYSPKRRRHDPRGVRRLCVAIQFLKIGVWVFLTKKRPTGGAGMVQSDELPCGNAEQVSNAKFHEIPERRRRVDIVPFTGRPHVEIILV